MQTPETNDALKELQKYNQSDWDGEGADPITLDTINDAREFLDMVPDDITQTPDIFPETDGGVTVLWKLNERKRQYHLELGFYGDKKFCCYLEMKLSDKKFGYLRTSYTEDDLLLSQGIPKKIIKTLEEMHDVE